MLSEAGAKSAEGTGEVTRAEEYLEEDFFLDDDLDEAFAVDFFFEEDFEDFEEDLEDEDFFFAEDLAVAVLDEEAFFFAP